MSDLVKNLLVLIASIIVVHLIYIGYVRPEANLLIEQRSRPGKQHPVSWLLSSRIMNRRSALF